MRRVASFVAAITVSGRIIGGVAKYVCDTRRTRWRIHGSGKMIDPRQSNISAHLIQTIVIPHVQNALYFRRKVRAL